MLSSCGETFEGGIETQQHMQHMFAVGIVLDFEASDDFDLQIFDHSSLHVLHKLLHR